MLHTWQYNIYVNYNLKMKYILKKVLMGFVIEK